MLAVGQPVRVKKAGEWLDDWAEVLAVNADGTYDVVVKPYVLTGRHSTLSDERGEMIEEPDGEYHRLDSSWYPLKDKAYPDEVVANEDESVIAKYLEYVQRDAPIQRIRDDLNRLRKPVEIMVVAHAAEATKASFTPLTVDLSDMTEVLDKMATFNLKDGGMGVDSNQTTTFFWHTKASREAMKGNFKVLSEAVGSRMMYLDGRQLGQDPTNRYCHELQRACVFSADNKVPIVVLSDGEKYDDAKWKDAAKYDDGFGCALM